LPQHGQQVRETSRIRIDLRRKMGITIGKEWNGYAIAYISLEVAKQSLLVLGIIQTKVRARPQHGNRASKESVLRNATHARRGIKQESEIARAKPGGSQADVAKGATAQGAHGASAPADRQSQTEHGRKKRQETGSAATLLRSAY